MFIKSYKLIKLFSFVLVALLLANCSGEVQTQEYTIETNEILFSGPLFSGPNSGQVTHKVDISTLPKNSKIKGVKLTSASVALADSTISNEDILSFVLQITSSNTSMSQVAVLNPFDGSFPANLTTSTDAELKDYFTSDEFYLILDADFDIDIEEDVMMKGTFKFEITYTN